MEPAAKKRRLAPKIEPQASPPSPHYAYDSSSAAVSIPPSQDAAPPPPPPPLPERFEFEAFARHLQDAAMLICRQTQKPLHTKASVLILQWEGYGGDGDATGTPAADVRALEHVLHERYRYSTHRYSIPSAAGSRSSLKLGVRVRSFLEEQGPDHLLIVVYAGHSGLDPDGEVHWTSNAGDDAVRIKWKGIRCLFEESPSDVLFLLDTRSLREEPIQTSNTGVQDVLACSSIDSKQSQLPSTTFSSFTAQLTEAFVKLADDNRLFTAEHLFHEIAMQRRHEAMHASSSLLNGTAGNKLEFHHDQLPLLYKLASGRGQSLTLSPMNSRSDGPPPHHQHPPAAAVELLDDEDVVIHPSMVDGLTFEEQRVLVCTTYVGEASSNMSSFNSWLQHRFADASPSSSSAISVEGMFLGPPTMLLISMPMAVWNVVQHDKVCCYLGCVSSHNMTHLYERLVRAPTVVSFLEAAKDVDRRLSQGQKTGAATTTPVSQHYNTYRDALPPRTPIRLSDDRLDPRSVPRSEAGRRPLDPEETAEMKAAAEQLSALSHVRHLSDEGTTGAASPLPLANHRGKRSFDAAMSSPQQDGAAFPNAQHDITPTKGKGQQRRSLAKQLLPTSSRQQHQQQDTQCEHCSHAPFKDTSTLRKHIAAAHTRPFPCAFAFAGCPSTFGSKNEWKRHIASQHLCLTYYRCTACLPQGNISSSGGNSNGTAMSESPGGAGSKGGNNINSNEFNRKDLFTQHLRRMHAPFAIKKSLTTRSDSDYTRLLLEWEAHVKEMQASCLVVRRRPPQRSACPNPGCGSVFEGVSAWDEWTEHVGRHMEKGEAAGGRMGADGLLAEWALLEGVIERVEGGGYRLVSGMGQAASPVVDGRRGSNTHVEHSASNSGSSHIDSANFGSPDHKVAKETEPAAAASPPPPPPPLPPPPKDKVVEHQENHAGPPNRDAIAATTSTVAKDDEDDRTIVAASTMLPAAMEVDG
ncbi:hypothetical protein Micbo1qcDRAFT_135059 [Microdochium bolleyi]|uniref:C2H2-type domain-containing protein n=1 Tax=Microdochium bolleyi TaxID=196109 RepID=A0A136J153_9PEZI|nr:hypothetical protein Micbo1qcDRAFT_135059 [Microdochium bolleyi]